MVAKTVRINQLKTFALLALLSGLIVLTGYLLVGDETGLYYGLAFAGISSLGSWYYSDRAALAAFKAQPTPKEEQPELYERIEKLSDRATGKPINSLLLFNVPNGCLIIDSDTNVVFTYMDGIPTQHSCESS